MLSKQNIFDEMLCNKRLLQNKIDIRKSKQYSATLMINIASNRLLTLHIYLIFEQ